MTRKPVIEVRRSQRRRRTVSAYRDAERIVVLHTLEEHVLERVVQCLHESQLPALWKPKPNAFIRVEQIPYLGTGKVDLRRVKETAQQLSDRSD